MNPNPSKGAVTTLAEARSFLFVPGNRPERFGKALRFCFGAKLCIHPRQFAFVLAAFAPSAEELARAARGS